MSYMLVNSWKYCTSSKLLYKSNRTQVSMVIGMLNHLLPWHYGDNMSRCLTVRVLRAWLCFFLFLVNQVNFISLQFSFDLAMSLTLPVQQIFHCFWVFPPSPRLFRLSASFNSPSPTNCSELVVILENPKQNWGTLVRTSPWTGFTSNLERSQPFLIASLHFVTSVLGQRLRFLAIK